MLKLDLHLILKGRIYKSFLRENLSKRKYENLFCLRVKELRLGKLINK